MECLARPHPGPMASQARHEPVSPKGTIASRYVVPREREQRRGQLECGYHGVWRPLLAVPCQESKDLRDCGTGAFTPPGEGLSMKETRGARTRPFRDNCARRWQVVTRKTSFLRGDGGP